MNWVEATFFGLWAVFVASVPVVMFTSPPSTIGLAGMMVSGVPLAAFTLALMAADYLDR